MEELENRENSGGELKVTSVEQLKTYANGEVVSLPQFAENQPFVARLKRPSMFMLVKTGKIPNALVVQANKLFASGSAATKTQVMNENMLDEIFAILDIVCEASFIEPTYQQIKEAGVELTDQQKIFIFNYSQMGVQALESFR